MKSSIRKLDVLTFDELLKCQNPFQSGICTFDLTRVQSITPGALVLLAAACHSLGYCGKQVSIVADNSRVRKYFVSSGFAQIMQDTVHFQPPISFQSSIFGMFELVHSYVQRTQQPLIGVTKIQSGAQLRDLLNHIVNVLQIKLKYKQVEAFDIAIAISEICQNIFEHNTEACGFFSMQVYKREPECFLEIGVADCGDGLATTLRRNPANLLIASDEDAIHLAIKLGTSEFNDPTRGMGLYHLLDIASKHSGSVHIRSGTAAMRFRKDKKRSFSVPSMPGVQIAFTLPTKG